MQFFRKIIESRQASANREIAHYLHRSEFRGESYDHILDMVNNGTIHDHIGRG